MEIRKVEDYNPISPLYDRIDIKILLNANILIDLIYW